ncbi:MAG: DUF3426 domain-containing protein [Hyphomicrobiales bacterium]|nr:DUF3426 domain-containing protein [Hyphomicrobiales bacterium]
MSLTYDALTHYPTRPARKGEALAPRKAGAQAEPGLRRRFDVLAVGLAFLFALLAWAKPGIVVSLLPRMAEVYASIGLPVNLRGLAFEHVAARLEEADKGRFLTIEGLLRNISRKKLDVPRLRLVLSDGMGNPVYSWTASSGIGALPPGETAPFRARLAAPPSEARKITVDLVTE